MWDPKDYRAAEADIAAGLVQEGAYLELKRVMLDNARLAKQLCAFSINGGVLVLGVREDEKTGRAVEIAPIPLRGEAERIAQIAVSRIDPPLAVEVVDLSKSPAEHQGVLLVHVDPSPLAPHQTAGCYYGRIDRTTGVLSDADVERLMRGRTSHQVNLRERMAERAANLLPSPSRPSGVTRMLVSVEPRPDRSPELLRPYIEGRHVAEWLQIHFEGAGQDLRGRRAEATAPLGWQLTDGPPWGAVTRTATGVAITLLGSDKDYFNRLEIDESGAVQVARSKGQMRTGQRAELHWQDVVTSVTFATDFAQRMWATTGARLGATIGVHLDGLKDTIPERPCEASGQPTRDMHLELHPYTEQLYQGIAYASPSEIAGDLTGVLDRLMGQLFRSLGLGVLVRSIKPPS